MGLVDPISQDDLDISIKTRANPLAWNGQFSPQLVESLIRSHGDGIGRISDPFAGSGTVAAEAIASGKAFTGTEVNPAAFLLSSVYMLANFPEGRRLDIFNHAEGLLLAEAPIEAAGLDYVSQLDVIRSNALPLEVRRLIAACLLLAYGSTKQTTRAKFLRSIERVRSVIAKFPPQSVDVRLRLADARVPHRGERSDLIITSPPYINVFNYHQQYRPAAEALGCNPLEVARSEIGANRKHRQNRFLTVVQYCMDLALAINVMGGALSPGGRIVLVLGRESSVLGTSFRNGEIALMILRDVFDVTNIKRLERSFINRFGQKIHEDLLCFSPGRPVEDLEVIRRSRMVGVEVLKRAHSHSMDGARERIKQAFSVAVDVMPSPLLGGESAMPAHLRSING